MESILLISPGTPKAMALFETLRSEGLLVDIYSREFFKRQPRWGDPKHPEAPFYSNGMEYIEACEADREGLGIFPKGHLWVLWLDRYHNKFSWLTRELLDLYPPLSSILKRRYAPDLLIFNLFTQKILSIGLEVGDTLELFAISPDGCKKIQYGDDFFTSFCEHDYFCSVEDDLLAAMNEIGYSFQIFHRLPSNREFIEISLDRQPNESGQIYIVDYSGTPVEDEPYTTGELRLILEKFNSAEESLKHAGYVLSFFFPSIDIWDLRKG